MNPTPSRWPAIAGFALIGLVVLWIASMPFQLAATEVTWTEFKQLVVDGEPENREQQDALRRAEVAAVDARPEYARQSEPTTVLVGLLAPPRERRRGRGRGSARRRFSGSPRRPARGPELGVTAGCPGERRSHNPPECSQRPRAKTAGPPETRECCPTDCSTRRWR